MTSFPVYFLIISCVVCSAMSWFYWRALQRHLPARTLLDGSVFVLIFGFLGARLTHAFYEYPQVYWEDPWRIFDFSRGGYVFFGGLVTGVVAGWVFLQKHKLQDPLQYFDLAAPVLSLGYATGRVACLLAGCCYGPITDLPWGFLTRDEHEGLFYRHPTPLYSSLLEILLLIFLLRLEKKKPTWSRPSGQIFFIWLMGHSFFRFILEFWRDDERGPQFIFSLSGWLGIFLFILSLCLFLRSSGLKKKVPRN